MDDDPLAELGTNERPGELVTDGPVELWTDPMELPTSSPSFPSRG